MCLVTKARIQIVQTIHKQYTVNKHQVPGMYDKHYTAEAQK